MSRVLAQRMKRTHVDVSLESVAPYVSGLKPGSTTSAVVTTSDSGTRLLVDKGIVESTFAILAQLQFVPSLVIVSTVMLAHCTPNA